MDLSRSYKSIYVGNYKMPEEACVVFTDMKGIPFESGPYRKLDRLFLNKTAVFFHKGSALIS